MPHIDSIEIQALFSWNDMNNPPFVYLSIHSVCYSVLFVKYCILKWVRYEWEPYSDADLHHGFDQQISAAGISWATMALSQATPAINALIGPG